MVFRAFAVKVGVVKGVWLTALLSEEKKAGPL